MRVPVSKVPGVEYIACDVREPISLDRNLDAPEIYNLAAVHTTPGHDDWEYFWTNVSGASNICSFAARTNSRCMVFTSSISTYGASEDPLDEKGPFRPDSAYGRSKLQAEQIHRLWKQGDAARRLIIVRPAVIFGPGENGNFTRLAKLLRTRLFFYPGRKTTVKACGYVGELVRSILFMRDLRQDEVTYNFAYPQRSTTEDICVAFHQVAGFKRPLFVIPLWLMLCGSFAFEVLAKLGLRTSINRSRILKLVHSTNIMPTKLLEAGYVFETDLKEGLLRWQKESGNDFV